MTLRPAAWPICLAAAVLVTACGSGADDTVDEPPASRPAVSARVDEPGRAATDGGAGVCSDRQRPDGRAYAVSQIPADDPDGGLVLLDGARDGVPVAILPSGAPVIATGDRAACAVLADGVWWRIRSVDGVRGWVDAESLSPRG